MLAVEGLRERQGFEYDMQRRSTYVIAISGFNGHVVNKKFDKLFPARKGQERPVMNERMKAAIDKLHKGDIISKVNKKHGAGTKRRSRS